MSSSKRKNNEKMTTCVKCESTFSITKKECPECGRENPEYPPNIGLRVFFVCLAMIALLVIYAFILKDIKLEGLSDSGQFGDMFGGATALFSGLAFVGIIWAIYLQKKELGCQRAELELTRKEMKGQKDQLERQAKIFEQQTFESTFFQLLKAFNECINNYTYTSTLRGEIITGRDLLRKHSRILDSTIRESTPDTSRDLEHTRLLVQQTCLKYPEGRKFDFIAFTTMSYRILVFIDSARSLDKSIYLEVFKALIPNDFYVIIFYEALSGRISGLKEICERFHFFKDLQEHLLSRPYIKQCFDGSAFGE